MKLIYLKSSLKCDSFDIAINIKIQFFKFWLLLSRIAPYYNFVYHELFDQKIVGQLGLFPRSFFLKIFRLKLWEIHLAERK